MANSRPPDSLPHLEANGAEDSDAGRALGIAYAYLNRRERTVAEVRERLERAELNVPAIEAAIEELLTYGYLDDRRYARVFAEDKRNLEQWGRDRIERGLSERGVDRDLIAEALASDHGGGELDRAHELLMRRFPGGPAEHRDRERAFGMLIRKGYDSELAADAIRAWAAD